MKIEHFQQFSNEGTGSTDNERKLTKRLPREENSLLYNFEQSRPDLCTIQKTRYVK